MTGARTVPSSARISSSRTSAKRAEWMWRIFALVAIAALSWVYYNTARRQTGAGVSHTLVLGLGWTGMSLAVMAAGLSARKRLAYQGAGRMSTWLKAHIYLGIVSAFAILLHSGFRAGGLLTTVLLAMFSLTVVSGLMGWWLSV